MATTTNLTEEIDEDPDWVDYLNPTQRKVLSDLKNQQEEFDIQYHEWQKELETWRKANANHSDPKSYRDYAQQWEEWRNKLLAQKDQMQRLYKLTLVQLKSQASKQKEQKKQSTANQLPPALPNHLLPPNPQPPSTQQQQQPQPLPTQSVYFYNQYPQSYNRPIDPSSQYFIGQRLPGVVPYQARLNQPSKLNTIVKIYLSINFLFLIVKVESFKIIASN